MCTFQVHFFQFNIFFYLLSFLTWRCIGGGTGRGFSLSWLHSQIQRNWVGTHQSQKTLNGYGDPTESMVEEGQVLDWGAHMQIWGYGEKRIH